jgi:glyoxylase-like metal-dependent hydrolase (beta-lactamase superfamily II)
MTDLHSTDFTPGRPVTLAPGVRRLTAPNGGPMTGPGTNAYLVGEERVVIVDPGPAAPSQVEALLAAVADAEVVAIAVTHTHSDHSPAAAPLARRLGVPVLGRPARHPLYQDATFSPTRIVEPGEALETDLGPMVAIPTPGHASNHLCWHIVAPGFVITGDHILGMVSPVILHPDGDLADYLDSLRRVAELDAKALLPGHGPVMTDARGAIGALIRHRLGREAKVVAALSALGAGPVEAIVRHVYSDVDPALHGMARHTLLAHLVKLQREGRAVGDGDHWGPA